MFPERLIWMCAGALVLGACGGGGGASSGANSGFTDSSTESGTDSAGTQSGGTDSDPTEPTDPTDPTDPTGDTDDGVADQAPSARPRVKFKTAERYAADLSNALSLPVDGLCSELDAFDCVTVHRVALGEVDAFGLRLLEPLESTPLTAPIAVDRIGLTACGERAARDHADPQGASTFVEVAGMDEPDLAAREAVVSRLYRQLLLREARDAERSAVAAMYDDLPADGRSQTWSQMACFAIATSTEALFY